ncbi:hypothetical protein [Haloterrigena salifodinae]|uniref:Uncharacterized protein n=1 Tax=Haloterrigena salifodinae TaxID=2675099 RepID=A0A8T8E0H6_9EURY|nr:hypothetical protein [Haloterrigena salifodinae]QRV14946.1 hypothetical protein JMJ58_18865 [Haloterrigena salifodinae]
MDPVDQLRRDQFDDRTADHREDEPGDGDEDELSVGRHGRLERAEIQELEGDDRTASMRARTGDAC